MIMLPMVSMRQARPSRGPVNWAGARGAGVESTIRMRDWRVPWPRRQGGSPWPGVLRVRGLEPSGVVPGGGVGFPAVVLCGRGTVLPPSPPVHSPGGRVRAPPPLRATPTAPSFFVGRPVLVSRVTLLPTFLRNRLPSSVFPIFPASHAAFPPKPAVCLIGGRRSEVASGPRGARGQAPLSPSLRRPLSLPAQSVVSRLSGHH